MDRIEELENKLSELIKESENVKNELQKLKNNKNNDETELIYPNDGDKVWFIDSYLEVKSTCWSNNDIKKNIYDLGEVFTTEEECKIELEYKLLRQKIENYSKRKGYLCTNDEIKNIDFKKYCIYYDFKGNNINFDYWWECTNNGLFNINFNSEKCAKDIIDKFGDEIIDFIKYKYKLNY